MKKKPYLSKILSYHSVVKAWEERAQGGECQWGKRGHLQSFQQ